MKYIVLGSYAPSGVESTSETSMILGEHFGARGRRMDKDTKVPLTLKNTLMASGYPQKVNQHLEKNTLV